jgi:hypothetical protein
MATGFLSNALSQYGLEAQSIAFFNTPGTSGDAIRMASASLIFDLNSFTFIGTSFSIS